MLNKTELLSFIPESIRKNIESSYFEGPSFVVHISDEECISNFNYTQYRANTNTRIQFRPSLVKAMSITVLKEYLLKNYKNIETYILQDRLQVLINQVSSGTERRTDFKIKTGWNLVENPIHSEFKKDVLHLLSLYGAERTKKLDALGQIIRSKKSVEPIKMFKLSAAGGFRGVGRSNYYLKASDYTIMLDAGIMTTAFGPVLPVLDWAEVKLNKVDAIIISHCHVDHTGYLAYILEYAYDGILYMTEPTFELCLRVVRDCIKFNTGAISELSVIKLITNTIIIDFNINTEILPGVELLLSRANHVLGAAMVGISYDRFKFLFTGDFKHYVNPAEGHSVLKPIDPLIFKRHYNSVLTEATCCLKGKEGGEYNPVTEETKLVELINIANERSLNVIVPCFTVGREYLLHVILKTLDKIEKSGNLNLKLHIDKSIYQSLVHHLDHSDLTNLEIVKSTCDLATKMNTPLTSDEKFLIISPSGMCEGGPIIGILGNYLHRVDTMMIFTGYQATNTLGYMISNKQITECELSQGIMTKIRCESYVVSVGRGHSTYANLFNFWQKLNISNRLIFTHGVSHGLNLVCSDWNIQRGGLVPVGVVPYCGDEILLWQTNQVKTLV